MTDWSSLILGADLSHWQRRPDFGKLEADGVRFCILKATERLGVDPDFDWNRNEAAKRNILTLAYPFLRPTDVGGTMKHFLKVVGAGCPVALDWEALGVTPTIVEAWMDACEGALGRAGIAYYGLYPPAPVTERIARWPRWLPRYPAHLSDGPGMPVWDGKSAVSDWSATWFIWQYTGHGRLPGVSGEIDLNLLSCDWDTFKAWHANGTLPAAKPALIPENAAPLQLHSTGPAVRALQQRLLLRFPITVDGDYGPRTQVAVSRFQVSIKRPPTGIADLATIQALNKV